MSTYFETPSTIGVIGKLLTEPFSIRNMIAAGVPEAPFSELAGQISENDILVGVYDKGPYAIAVHLNSVGEFTTFEQQYRRGEFIARQFFAVPRTLAEAECGHALRQDHN